MTADHESKEGNSGSRLILRGNVATALIRGISDSGRNHFMVYYIFEDGNLFLKDDAENVGKRKIEIKKGSIICLWTNHDTGFEEFCGYFDKNGERLPSDYSTVEFPERIHTAIRNWTKNHQIK